MYPAYQKIIEAKKECSVPIIDLDNGCKVDAQNLMDDSVRKIWKHYVPAEKKRLVKTGQSLKFIAKGGCDGTNGNQVFQHRQDPADVKLSTTQEVYITAVVPLHLFIEETGKYQNNTSLLFSLPFTTFLSLSL